MKDDLSQLKQLQQSLQEAILQPGTAMPIPGLPRTEDYIQSSGQLSAQDRINIYRSAYFARLFECFQASFPCLEYALEEELFRTFAFDYLHKYPSESYTLYKLGSRFPQYLEESRPDAGLPPAQREQWPDFIIELAKLERIFSEVYHAKQEEDSRRLMKSTYPVLHFFRAWKAGETPELPAPQEELILIERPEFVVRSRLLDLLEYEYLLHSFS